MDAVAQLIADWQATRKALRAAEEAEHPDVVDALGRAWQWVSGDLYRHDSMAKPLVLVTHPDVNWPTVACYANPNYQWCDTCKAMGEALAAAAAEGHELHWTEVA